MKQARALIIRAAGTNCNNETALAFELAGAAAEQAHMTELIKGTKKLDDFQMLAIPGGFSYGDDLGSGKVFANQMAIKLGRELEDFIASGKLVIGICNGFQVIIKMGIVPSLSKLYVQDATLTNNDSGKFEDRWVRLRSEHESLFTKGIKQLYLPVNHGEGKLVASKDVLEQLQRQKLITLRYADENGRPTDRYPSNPNNSMLGIAGITNRQGNVFGLMPHPEKYVSRYTHPRWTREQLPEEGDGLKVFKNMVEYAQEELV